MRVFTTPSLPNKAALFLRLPANPLARMANHLLLLLRATHPSEPYTLQKKTPCMLLKCLEDNQLRTTRHHCKHTGRNQQMAHLPLFEIVNLCNTVLKSWEIIFWDIVDAHHLVHFSIYHFLTSLCGYEAHPRADF